MALKTPYATIQEADIYLSENDAWLDLDNSAKNNHLINGRYYIDSNYTCTELVNGDPIPEEYVYANALLAEADLAKGLYTVDKTVNSPVVKKMVKAGEVESETTYAGSRSTSLSMNSVDPYPAITSILNEFCSLKNKQSFKTVDLIRS